MTFPKPPHVFIFQANLSGPPSESIQSFQWSPLWVLGYDRLTPPPPSPFYSPKNQVIPPPPKKNLRPSVECSSANFKLNWENGFKKSVPVANFDFVSDFVSDFAVLKHYNKFSGNCLTSRFKPYFTFTKLQTYLEQQENAWGLSWNPVG